jgi:hypothetical protein
MSTVFSRIFGYKKPVSISSIPTFDCEPDLGVEAFSHSVWNELSNLPHILSVIEEDALVDIIHHTYLSWSWEGDLGINLISYQTHDGHKISLASISSVTKLLGCHRAIAFQFKSSAGE